MTGGLNENPEKKMKTSAPKPWTEDEIHLALNQLKQIPGRGVYRFPQDEEAWNAFAKNVPGRTGKQCKQIIDLVVHAHQNRIQNEGFRAQKQQRKTSTHTEMAFYHRIKAQGLRAQQKKMAKMASKINQYSKKNNPTTTRKSINTPVKVQNSNPNPHHRIPHGYAKHPTHPHVQPYHHPAPHPNAFHHAPQPHGHYSATSSPTSN